MKKTTAILLTRTTLFFLFTIVCRTSPAQQLPFFINSTEAEGLSDNRITCFYKDKTGYIWIGTENGLNRYDGNDFKVYRPSDVRKNNLSNAFITSVAQDKAGHIWVTTRRGLNRIDAFTDSIEIIYPLINRNIELPAENIWDVFPDSDTAVWIVIDTKDFVRYNPVTKQVYYFDFKRFLKENNIEYTPVYHSVFKIAKKSLNEFWLATTEGIFSFNKTNGTFKIEYGVALDEITFFHYEATTGKLYCADERKILYIYETFKHKMIQVQMDAGTGADKYLLPYHADKDGLFVPAPEGLVWVNEKNEIAAFIKSTDNKENRLQPGKITAIYKDRENITWIGTPSGVSRFIPQQNANLHISFPANLQYDPEYSLKNFTYYDKYNEWLVASYSDNKIWKVNNNSGIVSAFIKPPAYSNDTCYAFYFRHPDTLFMLCDRSLLTWYCKENKWNKISFPKPWNIGTLTCMTIDSEGNYWLGTRRRGVIVYNTTSKITWSPTEEQVEANIVHAVQFDRINNCVWIGSYHSGLYQFNVTNKTYCRIRRNDTSIHSFHSSLINDIALDNRNNIWSATVEGGLARYLINSDPYAGVTNFESKNGLPDNNVYSVTANENSDIWFTTSKGIGCISNTGKLKPFLNKESGLPYSKFQQSILSLPGGKIATAVENNLFCFDVATVMQSGNSNLIIHTILLNDSIPVNRNSTFFDYWQNNIRFDFTLLDFVSPAAVEYFYQLKGFDKDWISNGRQRSIRYSELPPGSYIFKVKAKKANGEFNAQLAEWAFEIEPPFWKRWWFLSFSVLLGGYLVFFFFKERILKIRQQEKFKREYEKKIAEVEMQALRAQMNPHFMFNSLNSINNFILKNDADNASGYLTKFSRLMRLILDNSRSEWVLLINEMKALELYVELEAVRFDNAFAYSIKVEPGISIETVAVPPLLIQPYVENAIWHGLLHRKEPGGKLNVRVWKQLEQLHIEIEDNGVGREEASRLKSKTATRQKSHGMKITAERIDIVNKVYNVNAGVTITDLKDQQGNATGTKILLTLQYKMYDSHNSG